jgi:hypothetical protein
MGRIRKLFEDAFRIKVLPKDNEYEGVAITDDKEDLANKQIKSADSGSLVDVDAINRFRTLSSDRQERYTQFEDLLKDATVAAAIEMYADDATQYDYRSGKVIWAESENPDIAKAANRLLDVLRINENSWTWIYALCAYGDVYLRLYRKGDVSDYNDAFSDHTGLTAIRVKKEDSTRPIEEYVEYVDDPAVMYDLQVRDKTSGFIKMVNAEVEQSSSMYTSLTTKTLDLSDVNIYDRKSFVHICLAGNIDRHPELIALHDSKTGSTSVYKVKTGKSILADAYDAAQTVKLLEDSMMLSRVTKSALVRILQIEVGNMPKPEVESLLRRIKNMIEQKMALNKQNGVVASYNSPGPIENIVYVPTKEGKGAITSNNLGGDVNIKDIVDVDYFNNKKLSALKIPKQYLNYDAPEGLGNGTSLTKLSSRYAHTIMRIQNAYISGITNLLNLYFLDKGLDYINNFTLKMVSPATIEDTERDEMISNRLNQARDILDLLDGKVDEKTILKVTDWLFGTFLNLSDISKIISEVRGKEKFRSSNNGRSDMDININGDFGSSPDDGFGGDFGGDFGNDFESPDMGGEDFGPSPDIGGGPESMESPM